MPLVLDYSLLQDEFLTPYIGDLMAVGGRRKRSATETGAVLPKVDVFLNPARREEMSLVEEYLTNITRALFDPPLPKSSYPHLFRLLRHTNLPCVPSEEDNSHMILRYMSCKNLMLKQVMEKQCLKVSLEWDQGEL